jgi:hypothetical protein
VKRLLFLALFFSSPAHAVNLPAHWCPDAAHPCSAPQQDIWNRFFAADTPVTEPAVYTGECYFKSYYQDPARRAYGVAVLARGPKEGLYYGGQFAEFFDSNPWDNITQSEAARFVRFENRFRLVEAQDHDWVNVSNSPEHFIYYWFRLEGTHLLLLGQGDGTVLSFCDLAPKVPNP